MIIHLIVIAIFTVLLPLSSHIALAETVDISPPTLESPLASPDAAEDFIADSLSSDDDLTADLAAEALPTTNQFSYRWELFRNGVLRFFTLKATQKALLYEQHLHTLDRKLAACAEIGDEKCAQLVEERMEKLTNRATDYLSRREELKEQILDRFQTWRDRREALITDRHERARQLQTNREALVSAREDAMDNARKRRAIRQEAVRTNIERRMEATEEEIEQRQDNNLLRQQNSNDQQQLNLEQRRINQRELIEMRSGNLKNQLDATEEQVQVRQEAALDAP